MLTEKSTKIIPLWITIVSGLISAVGLFVGASLYISPGTFLPHLDFSSVDIRYLVNMWAARQIAIAAIIGYSLIKQSLPMIKLSLLAYCIMNVQDIVIGIIKLDNGLIIGASIACGVSAFMIFTLTKKLKNNG